MRYNISTKILRIGAIALSSLSLEALISGCSYIGREQERTEVRLYGFESEFSKIIEYIKSKKGKLVLVNESEVNGSRGVIYAFDEKTTNNKLDQPSSDKLDLSGFLVFMRYNNSNVTSVMIEGNEHDYLIYADKGYVVQGQDSAGIGIGDSETGHGIIYAQQGDRFTKTIKRGRKETTKSISKKEFFQFRDYIINLGKVLIQK